MKRSSLAWVLIIGAVLCGLFVVSLMALMLVMSDGEKSFGSGDRIAVIPVEGVIDDAMAKRVNRYLKLYADDSRIKAIMLRVDSPGGGVSPSQEIYREIRRAREEKKKKIVVSMGSVAASGGYYIACPADRIFANPGTVTGSIGVIAEWINIKDLAEWAKVKPVVFKSGEFKDTGSPTRELTEREKVYFQGMIDELYGQFVTAVSEGRNGRGPDGSRLDPTRVRELADGRVYTGQSALEHGLIDKLGNYGDALTETAKMVGIKGEPNVVTPPKEREGFSILDLLLGVAGMREFAPASLPATLGDLDTSVKFKYQWK
ncbi:MAG: signal peptide peptidase SppA [Acidobacteriota bacterium]|nr:MAG: signal peptide peptidase SppA [Acidobacteriota bacterium]